VGGCVSVCVRVCVHVGVCACVCVYACVYVCCVCECVSGPPGQPNFIYSGPRTGCTSLLYMVVYLVLSLPIVPYTKTVYVRIRPGLYIYI